MATRRPSRTQAPKKHTAGPAVRTSKARARSGQELTIQPAAGKPILITDVALRDGHQSLLATRMRTEDMLPIAQKLDAVGYWSLEVWGGATFDTCLRFLKEDPWERLRALRAAMPNTKLQMLLRGQNLVGYRHYADDVLERFIERSAANGIDVFRIFDALNDVRNVEQAMREVKACGKHVEAAICYTVSPVHSVERFVDMAKQLEDLGTDTLCIKDMAGLLAPLDAYHLIRRIKAAVKVPIHLHSHYTSGMASMTSLMAILGGLDMLDTSISPLAGGTSHPSTETLVASLRNTPYDTGLDLASFLPITEHFRTVRRKYRQFESEFTGVDAEILTSQIPGGMLSNLAAQLTEQNALDRIKEVLDEVPRVRKELGYPPLVTPTSQIVGTQATLNVLTGERYKVITTETKNYFLGLYGRAPGPLDRDIMARAIGDDQPIKTRPADRLEPELEAARKDLPASAYHGRRSAFVHPVPRDRARLLRGAREGGPDAGTPRELLAQWTGCGHRTPFGSGRIQRHGPRRNLPCKGVRFRTEGGRTQTLLHPSQRQTRRSLVGADPGDPGRRAGSSRCWQAAPNAKRPRAVQARRRGASDAGPRRQSTRRHGCHGQGRRHLS